MARPRSPPSPETSSVLRRTDRSGIEGHALIPLTVNASGTVMSVIAMDELTCRSVAVPGSTDPEEERCAGESQYSA
jgi:hypothetical protein